MWDECIRHPFLQNGIHKVQHSVSYLVYQWRESDTCTTSCHLVFPRWPKSLYFMARAFLWKPKQLQGAQRFLTMKSWVASTWAYYEKKKRFSTCQKGKVCCLWHLGTSWIYIIQPEGPKKFWWLKHFWWWPNLKTLGPARCMVIFLESWALRCDGCLRKTDTILYSK